MKKKSIILILSVLLAGCSSDKSAEEDKNKKKIAELKKKLAKKKKIKNKIKKKVDKLAQTKPNITENGLYVWDVGNGKHYKLTKKGKMLMSKRNTGGLGYKTTFKVSGAQPEATVSSGEIAILYKGKFSFRYILVKVGNNGVFAHGTNAMGSIKGSIVKMKKSKYTEKVKKFTTNLTPGRYALVNGVTGGTFNTTLTENTPIYMFEVK